MNLRGAIYKLAGVAASCIIGLMSVAAVVARPWPIGRLLRSVSLPRMREHRLRTSLTVLGVALGVAVLVAVVTVNHSIVVGAAATLNDLSGKADLQVSGGASGFDEAVLDSVRDIDGVYRLTPVSQQIASLRTNGDQRDRLLILGVDLLGQEDAYFRDYVSKELTEIRRDPLLFLNSANNIILSRQLAQRLGTRLHDKLRISTSSGIQEFEVWGFIEDEGVGRAFGGSVAVMYYPAMQAAFSRGRNIDRIDIAVRAGADVASVRAALQARLGEGFDVDRPALRGDRISKMLGAMRAGLNMSSFIALIAGVFLVFNTCAISVVQRKRELGILRALALTRGQLIRLLTLEGALLGFAGSVLGVGIGVVLARGMLRVTGRAVDELYMQQSVDRVQIDPWLLAAAFLLGCVCSALAARFATQRAGGIRPVDALSPAVVQSVLTPARGFGRSDFIAIGLTLVTIVLLVLPAAGRTPVAAFAACAVAVLAMQAMLPRAIQWSHRVLSGRLFGRAGAAVTLAVENLPRDLGRSAGMASGLMAGVSLTVSVATFIASFITSLNSWSEQVLPGDLFVTSGAAISGMSARNTPMEDALRGELLALPGVTETRRIRIVESQYRDTPIKLSVSEFRILYRDTKLTLLEGDPNGLLADLERGAVAVSENFSSTFGVHRGDRINLATAFGTRTFEVAAVVVDYSSDAGSVLMDLATYRKAWADDRVDTYELRLAPHASRESVRDLIHQNLAEKHDLFVLTNAEFRSAAMRAAEQIFGLLRTLEFLTLLVAALGLMTSVLANVMDRVKELGVLRALGMLRSQIVSMIIVETVIVGAIGTAAGVVLGSAVGYLVLTRVTSVLVGWHLPFQLPVTSVIQLGLVTLAISAAAGIIPARRAAGLAVRNAIDHV